jgi:hypothetical protein
MSTGNGHDPLTAQIVDILQSIREEIRSTNGRLDALHEDHIALAVEVKGIRTELNSFRSETHVELELLREDLKEDYGARIARLEAVVFKPAAE